MQNEGSQMQQSAYLTLEERQIYFQWSKVDHRSPRTPVGRGTVTMAFNEAYRWWKIMAWYIGTSISQVTCVNNTHTYVYLSSD